jgi:PsbP-like protein
MKKATIFTFCFFVATLFAQETNTRAFIKADYNLLYPSSWTIDTSGNESTQLILYAPSKGNFAPNINLIVQEVMGDLKLSDIKDATIKEIKKGFDKCKIIESTIDNSKNPERMKLVYSGNMQDYKLQWMQYLWLYKSKLYILTFTALQKGYKKDIKEATFIFDSFKFN